MAELLQDINSENIMDFLPGYLDEIVPELKPGMNLEDMLTAFRTGQTLDTVVPATTRYRALTRDGDVECANKLVQFESFSSALKGANSESQTLNFIVMGLAASAAEVTKLRMPMTVQGDEIELSGNISVTSLRDSLSRLIEDITQTGDTVSDALQNSGYMPYRHFAARGAGCARIYVDDPLESGKRIEVFIADTNLENPENPHVWLSSSVTKESMSDYVRLVEYDTRRFEDALAAHKHPEPSSFATLMTYTFYLDGMVIEYPVLTCPSPTADHDACDCKDPLQSDLYGTCGTLSKDDRDAARAIHEDLHSNNIQTKRRAYAGRKSSRSYQIRGKFSNRAPFPKCYDHKLTLYPPFFLTVALYHSFCRMQYPGAPNEQTSKASLYGRYKEMTKEELRIRTHEISNSKMDEQSKLSHLTAITAATAAGTYFCSTCNVYMTAAERTGHHNDAHHINLVTANHRIQKLIARDVSYKYNVEEKTEMYNAVNEFTKVLACIQSHKVRKDKAGVAGRASRRKCKTCVARSPPTQCGKSCCGKEYDGICINCVKSLIIYKVYNVGVEDAEDDIPL